MAIFDAVQDWDVLAANAPAGAEIVVLDSRREGLRELAAALDGGGPVDALHVFSHGSPGALHLGRSQLTSATSTTYAAELAALGVNLAAGADVLFYGCEVARDAEGVALLQQVAAATGADVAASTTLTGAPDKGGDWTLEAMVGNVNHLAVLDVPSYPNVLQTLQSGDMVVLGWNSFTDTITFATLVAIPAGTTIYITDRGWDQATNNFTASMTADGLVEWVTTSPIAAGTVFSLYLSGSDGSPTLTNVTTAADLSFDIIAGGWSTTDPMGIAGDGVFIYQDPGGTPRFLFGLNNSAGTVDASNWNTSVAITLRDSMLPNGSGSLNALTNGVDAIGLPGGGAQQDNVQYTGATTATDRATWLTRIANAANWSGDNTGVTGNSVGSSLGMAAPNTAPTVGSLGGDTVAFVEGATAVHLDAGGNATVTDVDSADFSGGTVTAAIVTNRVSAEDVLGIANVGTSAGQIGVSGANVTYGGVTIGSATGGTGTNDLVVSLNANATPAATQALVRALTYRNANTTDPNTATRAVRVTANDGDGGTSTNADVSVTITPVNDAPTLSATGATTIFTEGGAAADLFSAVTVSTVETGQTIQGIVLTVTNVTNGASEILHVDGTDIALTNGNVGTTSGNGLSYSVSVTATTATMSLSSLGVTPATAQTVVDGMTYRNASSNPTVGNRVITLTAIADSGGTANGGVDTTVTSVASTVTVSAVNDAPVVTTSGGTTSFTEADGPSSTPVVVDAGLTVADPDSSSLAWATVAVTDAFSPEDVLGFTNDGLTMGNITGSYNAAIGVLTLTSAGQTATLAQWQAALRSVTFGATSQTPSATTRTISITVADGEAASIPATKAVSVTSANDSPVVDAPPTYAATEDTSIALTGISFSDADAGSSAVTATLSVPSGALAASSGSGVTVGGTSSALTLTGSLANINTFIAASQVTFTPAASATASVTLTAAIDDGGHTGSGGAKTDSDTSTIQVTAINDRPDITAPTSLSITEDLATPLTGIAFADVDAGSNPVTVSFAVTAGTLAATAGAGVGVTGSDTAMLTLAGTVADINVFVAASNIVFIPVSNSTTGVTLTLHIDDGGNTGADPGTSGTSSSETRTTTVTLTVDAVNDAPVHTVPGTQTTVADTNLVFSTAEGNVIAVSDADAGSHEVEVTLTATDGVLTLATTSGLSLLTGSGKADATLTMVGTLAHVNAALDGLTFTPAHLFTGSASVQITTDDMGHSGPGGAKQATDTVTIDVTPGTPRVLGVTSTSANGTYKPGDTIAITVTFDRSVTVNPCAGTPFLLLETGTVDRMATYATGSSSETLTFTYVVQAGDLSADLDYTSTAALAANGGLISGDGDMPADLTLPVPGTMASLAGHAALVVDGVGPRVVTVAVPPNGTYTTGQHLDLTVVFDEVVTVNTTGGLPTLQIALDTGGPVHASYLSGSGTASLVFRGFVTPGQRDDDGIAIGPLALNGATLRDAAGNDSALSLVGIAPTSGVLVDTEAPGISIGAPSVTSTVRGPVTFTVTYTGASSVSLSDAHVMLTPTGSVAGTVTVSGSGAETREVTVSDISGSGSFTISLAAGTAADAGGNTTAAAGPSASVVVEERRLTAVSPSGGLAEGGIAVTVRGVGFIDLVAPVVQFGGVAATSVRVISDTEMLAITPQLAAGGAVDVDVVSGGTSMLLQDAYTPLEPPSDATYDTDSDTLPDAWEVHFGLDPLSADDASDDNDNDGRSNLVEFAEGTHPRKAWHRAFAEGVVTDTFRTTLSVFNPRLERASVVVHYYVDGAPPVRDELEIAPGASLQHDLSIPPNLPRGTFAIGLESNVDLVATSLTTWDADAYGAGAESAIEPAGTWYLAEGATHGPFDLFYLVANPNPFAVDLDVTFLRPSPGQPLVRRYTVGALGRTTLWVDVLEPELASTDVSAIVRAVGGHPVVVERAMYAHDGSGRWGAAGHRAAGVARPSALWHLAEGHVGGIFDTYLLVANPNAELAEVTVEAVGEYGVVHTGTHTVAPGSRLTLFAGDMPVPLGATAFTVRTDTDTPIVVERAMWWRDGPQGSWVESHASSGETTSGRRWGVTDVRLGGTRNESQYLLVKNVAHTPTSLDVTLTLDDGSTVTRSFVVAGDARLTVDLRFSFPEAMGRVASAVADASDHVVVEASRYWDAGGTRWGAGTNVKATPLDLDR